MSRSSSIHWTSWVPGLVVTALFVTLVLWRVDLREVWRVVGDAKGGWVAAAVVFGWIGIALRAARWRLVASPAVELSAPEALRGFGVGNVLNLLLPTRLGDLVRIRQATRGGDRSMAFVLVLLTVERLLDLLVLSMLLWSVVVFAGRSEYVILALALTLVLVVAVILSRSMGREPEPHAKEDVLSGRVAGWMRRSARSVREALHVLSRSPRIIVKGLAWSLVAWTFSLLAVWAALKSVSIVVPPAGVVLAETLFELAGVLPSAPAFIGTSQAAAVAALWSFDVSAERAVAFSFAYQASFVIASLSFGGASYLANGSTLAPGMASGKERRER